MAEATVANAANPKARLEKLVTFKLNILQQNLERAYAAAFSSLSIAAGASEVLTLRLSGPRTGDGGGGSHEDEDGLASEASWEWSIEKLDVDFSVEWIGDDDVDCVASGGVSLCSARCSRICSCMIFTIDCTRLAMPSRCYAEGDTARSN